MFQHVDVRIEIVFLEDFSSNFGEFYSILSFPPSLSV